MASVEKDAYGSYNPYSGYGSYSDGVEPKAEKSEPKAEQEEKAEPVKRAETKQMTTEDLKMHMRRDMNPSVVSETVPSVGDA